MCSRVYRDDARTCPDDGSILVTEASIDDGEWRLGRVLGSYRLLRKLGDGGAATVYEAEHVRLGRKMAIKVLHPEVASGEIVTRFFNEARAVNEIRHPGLVEIEDFVSAGTEEPYLVMELLTGSTLAATIARDGHLRGERVARIGAQIASALAAVHAVGIVHRDLKPENIFLVERDDKEIVKLLDFGVAKFTTERQGVTREGLTIGTPAYMAPEQIVTGGTIGPGCDVYSLGMVLYEALTGAPAFSGEVSAILHAHLRDRVVPPSERLGEPVPPVLEAAVLKCLHKDPAGRFATAAEVADALRADHPVEIEPVPLVRDRRKARAPRSIEAIVAVSAVASLVLNLWPRVEGHPAAAPSSAVVIAPPARRAQAAPPPGPPPWSLAIATNGEAAEIFLGTEGKPLGATPVTVSVPVSTEPLVVVARFRDGVEVTETIIPDGPRPPVIFAHPAAKRAITTARPTAAKVKLPAPTRPPNPAMPTGHDGQLDPFRQ